MRGAHVNPSSKLLRVVPNVIFALHLLTQCKCPIHLSRIVSRLTNLCTCVEHQKDLSRPVCQCSVNAGARIQPVLQQLPKALCACESKQQVVASCPKCHLCLAPFDPVRVCLYLSISSHSCMHADNRDQSAFRPMSVSI
jgi:hypothetical protein